jgi:hypothetical protein
MVTSQKILDRTGQTMKTLTRWHKAGVIPKPTIGTSPSGRGKMAYWPDWVLERCVQIADLQKQGHSLHSAVALLDAQRVSRLIEGVTSAPDFSKKLVTVGERQVKFGDIFSAMLVGELKKALAADVVAAIVPKLRQSDALDVAITMYRNGFNPVLAFDGEGLTVTYDFLAGQQLSAAKDGNIRIYMPLLPTLRKLFQSSKGAEFFAADPKVTPAPKVWTRDGDDIVETTYYPMGDVCEMIHETAQVVASKGLRPDPEDHS